MRCSHPSFTQIVSNSFSINLDLTKAIAHFELNISKWNKETFGNIFHKKKILLARLTGIQSSNAYPHSPFLQDLDQKLKEEYSDILSQEQEFWSLKSRISWLTEGDSNTNLFHISTLIRRRRNRINSLKNDMGNWSYTQTEIKDTITQYYSSIYSIEHLFSPFNCQNNPSFRGLLSPQTMLL